jgi:hypothetical protein
VVCVYVGDGVFDGLEDELDAARRRLRALVS